MFKSFIALLLISAGVTAAHNTCGEFSEERGKCASGNAPKKFPVTAEELNEVCEYGTQYFECLLDYAKRCDGDEKLKRGSRLYLELASELCNENTLLYSAVVQNLKCYDRVLDEKWRECSPYDGTEVSLVPEVVKSLSEEGHLTIPEDESEIEEVHFCVENLMEMACFASKFDEECGTVAMDAYIEIMKTAIKAIECQDLEMLLPVLMRHYKSDNAVVQNLRCYDRLIDEKKNECLVLYEIGFSLAPEIVKSLSEEGHLTIPEDEYEVEDVEFCVEELLRIACFASNYNEECGTAAMDHYIEIVKPAIKAMECQDLEMLLPVLMRRFKSDNGISNPFLDIFRRRK